MIAKEQETMKDLFATLKDNLKRKQHLVESKKEIVVETNVEVKTPPVPSQYRPSRVKLNALEEVKETLVNQMMDFSFSLPSNIHKYILWNDICKVIFPFKKSQIERMSQATKSEVIERGLIGYLATFKAGRKSFFLQTEMIEEDYQLNRLSYLLRHQCEPSRVYSDEEYAFITIHFEKMAREAMELYFALDSSVQTFGTSNRLLAEFHGALLEKFETFSDTNLLFQQNHINGKIARGEMTTEDIEAYLRYKTPLLTIDIEILEKNKKNDTNIPKRIETGQDNIMYKKFFLFEFCRQHPETICAMLTDSTAKRITEYMIDCSNLEEESFADFHDKNDIRNRMTIFVKNITPFIQMLEERFSS